MVTFVGSDSGGGNVTTFATTPALNDLKWPTVGTTDYALLFQVMQNTATATVPSGFTVLGGSPVDDASCRVYVMGKPTVGSEDGTDVGAGASLLNRTSALIDVLGDVNLSTPIDDIAFLAELSAGSTTHACPSVTPSVPDCVVVTFIAERATSGTTSWTAPAGYTKRADSTTAATGSGGSICAAADDGLAAGRPAGVAVTPPPWTSATGFAGASVMVVTVALRPSSSTVSGVAVASLAFSASAAGVRTVGATAAASLSFTAAAAGTRTAIGAAVASLGFAATSAGTRTVLGSASASLAFTAAADGVRGTFGQASAALDFAASAAGTRTVQGAGSAALAFTATASGTATHVGAAAANLDFTATASGVREVLGTGTAALGFTAAATGVVDSAGEVNGTALAALGFAATATGTRTVLATAAANLAFTAAATAERTIRGSASADLGFIGTATGTLTRFGQATAALLFAATASGRTVDDLTAAVHGVSASQPTQYVTAGPQATVTGSAPTGAVRRTA